MNLNLQKLLTVGTDAIPKFTADALGASYPEITDAPLWHFLTYEPWGTYGWIVDAESETKVIRSMGHIELSELIEFCRNNRIRYLQLDCDARTPKLFSRFEW